VLVDGGLPPRLKPVVGGSDGGVVSLRRAPTTSDDQSADEYRYETDATDTRIEYDSIHHTVRPRSVDWQQTIQTQYLLSLSSLLTVTILFIYLSGISCDKNSNYAKKLFKKS